MTRLEFSWVPFLFTNLGLIANNKLKNTQSILVKEGSKKVAKALIMEPSESQCLLEYAKNCLKDLQNKTTGLKL